MDKNEKVKSTETSSKADEDIIPNTTEIENASEKKAPRWRGTILVSSLIAALTYIFWPLWGPGLPSWAHKALAPVMEVGRTAGNSDRVDDLTRRVEAIENKLELIRVELKKIPENFSSFKWLKDNETIKTIGDVQNAQSSKLRSLVIELNNLGKELEALNSSPQSSKVVTELKELRINAGQNLMDLRKENESLNKAIQNLEKRMEGFEFIPKIKPRSGKRGALLLALSQLKNSVATPNNFTGPLSALRFLSSEVEKNSEAFLTLKKFAVTGVKDFSLLRQNFLEVSNDIVRASYTPAGEGWVDQTIFKLSQLVKFRRTGPEGALHNDVAGKVARAEMRLDARDLRGAVVIIKDLSGDAAKISQKWLADAEARLAVDSAIDNLFSNAIKTNSSDAAGR